MSFNLTPELASKLQFRRVYAPDPNTIKITGYNVYCASELCQTGDEPELALHYEPGNLPEDMMKPGNFNRFVEVVASYFKGYCKPQNTKFPYANHASDSLKLSYSSTTNFSLNLETGKWEDTPYRVPPRDNDLICGLVDTSHPGHFTKWFICSEQFCRTVMLLRIAYSNPDKTEGELEEIALDFPYFSSLIEDYDATSTDDLKVAEEMGICLEPKMVRETLKRLIKRGNTTCIGCAVHKVIAAREHNGAEKLTPNELANTYSRSRCESYTRRSDCVHLYTAIITRLFYKEKLVDDADHTPENPSNVPKNIIKPPRTLKPNQKPPRTEVTLKWVVPDFIRSL